MSYEYRDLEEKINHIVQEALDSKNYENLSKKINSVIDNGIFGFSGQGGAAAGRAEYERRKAYMNASNPRRTQQRSNGGYKKGYAGRPYSTAAAAEHAAQVTARQEAMKRKAEMDELYKTPAEATSGKLMMIFGIIGDVLFGSMALFNALMAGILQSAGLGSAALVGLAFTAISAALTVVGVSRVNFVSRFKKYCTETFKKKYSSVSDLAKAVGKSEEVVLKDIKKLIANGSFKQGHLDRNESTVIVTDDLFAQYLATQARSDELRAEEAKKEQEMAGLPKDEKKILETGYEYIEKIRKANEALPDPEITQKLSKLEMIITKIFARVKERPREARKLDQFMEYYLPTTWKLIEAYQEMDAQPIQGENIIGAKKEILDSLDSINDAYEKLLDTMFRDKALDVSTDISVMQSMMKQDGLTEGDFETSGSFAQEFGQEFVEDFIEGTGGAMVQEQGEGK